MHQTTMKTKSRKLQHACKKGGCRERQQWEQEVRFWLFVPHWSSCQKIKIMQGALFYRYFWKQKISTCCFLLVNTGTSPNRTKQSFSGGKLKVTLQLVESATIRFRNFTTTIPHPWLLQTCTKTFFITSIKTYIMCGFLRSTKNIWLSESLHFANKTRALRRKRKCALTSTVLSPQQKTVCSRGKY